MAPEVRAPRCGDCGHWSEATETGLGPGTGHCAYWQRLRERKDTCAQHVTKRRYARLQADLAARHEEWLD